MPYWNEEATFTVTNSATELLYVTIYEDDLFYSHDANHTSGDNDIICNGIISLAAICKAAGTNMWHSLYSYGKFFGKLNIISTWTPTTT